jgi:hypothetical protein
MTDPRVKETFLELGVLPVPPFQALGLGAGIGGEVDRAAEGVEDTAVLVDAAELAELLIEPLRIAAA